MADGTPQPIELTLKDGSVIRGASAEEALKMAAKMKEDTSDALRSEREARTALEAQVASLSTQVASMNRPAPAVNGQFDRDRYYKLLNEDPAQANDYYMEKRFGR